MSDASKPNAPKDFADRITDLLRLREEVEEALLNRLENVGSTESDASEALGAMRGFWHLIEAVSDLIEEVEEEAPATRENLTSITSGLHAAIELSLVIGMHLDVTDTARILQEHEKANRMRAAKAKSDQPRLDKREAALREFIGDRSIEKHAAFADSIFSAPVDSKGGLADLNRVAEKHGVPPFKRSTTKSLLRKMWLEACKRHNAG